MLILYKRFVIAYCVIVAIAIVDKKGLLSVLYASESLKWPLSNVDKCTYICEEKHDKLTTEIYWEIMIYHQFWQKYWWFS